jgi:hypothetical protein
MRSPIERHSEEAEQVVRDIPRAVRRQYSADSSSNGCSWYAGRAGVDCWAAAKTNGELYRLK